MTRKEIVAELKKTRNSTHYIGGFKIAHVGWKDYGRMIIENEETFDDAAKDDFTPIDSFRTQKNLEDRLYNILKQK